MPCLKLQENMKVLAKSIFTMKREEIVFIFVLSNTMHRRQESVKFKMKDRELHGVVS